MKTRMIVFAVLMMIPTLYASIIGSFGTGFPVVVIGSMIVYDLNPL